RSQLVANPRANLKIEDDSKRKGAHVWRTGKCTDTNTRSQSGNQVLTKLAIIALLPGFGQSHQDAQCAKHTGHTKPRDACRSASGRQSQAGADGVEHRLYGPGRQRQANGDLDATAPHISRSAPHARPIARLQPALNRLVEPAEGLDDEVEDGRPNLANLAKLPIGQPFPCLSGAIDGPIPRTRQRLLNPLDGSGPVGVPQPFPTGAEN